MRPGAVRQGVEIRGVFRVPGPGSLSYRAQGHLGELILELNREKLIRIPDPGLGHLAGAVVDQGVFAETVVRDVAVESHGIAWGNGGTKTKRPL